MTVVIASPLVCPVAVIAAIVMILGRVPPGLRVLVAGWLGPTPLRSWWMSLAGLGPLVVALRSARRTVLGAVALAGFRRRRGLDRRWRHYRRRGGCRRRRGRRRRPGL